MTRPWADHTPHEQDTAAHLFGLLSTLDWLTDRDAPPPPPRPLTMADLVRLADDPDAPLGPDARAALDTDARLRADWECLLRRGALAHLPRAAAASSGALARREDGGFRITLRPSRADPDQVYVLIELGPAKRDTQPRALFILGGDHKYLKHPLPPAVDGAVQVLAEAGSDLVTALRDPATQVFVR